jgi:hypothetical protein
MFSYKKLNVMVENDKIYIFDSHQNWKEITCQKDQEKIINILENAKVEIEKLFYLSENAKYILNELSVTSQVRDNYDNNDMNYLLRYLEKIFPVKESFDHIMKILGNILEINMESKLILFNMDNIKGKKNYLNKMQNLIKIITFVDKSGYVEEKNIFTSEIKPIIMEKSKNKKIFSIKNELKKLEWKYVKSLLDLKTKMKIVCFVNTKIINNVTAEIGEGCNDVIIVNLNDYIKNENDEYILGENTKMLEFNYFNVLIHLLLKYI